MLIVADCVKPSRRHTFRLCRGYDGGL